MALTGEEIVQSFGGNDGHRRRDKRNRAMLGGGLGLGALATLTALIAANTDSLTMAPNPDQISLEMANVAATRFLSECRVGIENGPRQLRGTSGTVGQSNFTTAPMAYGQDLCVEDVFNSLPTTIEGCKLTYVQSGWAVPGELVSTLKQIVCLIISPKNKLDKILLTSPWWLPIMPQLNYLSTVLFPPHEPVPNTLEFQTTIGPYGLFELLGCMETYILFVTGFAPCTEPVP
jgi:hypothetical protein